MKSGFKRTLNYSRYHRKTTAQQQNWYLDFLINPNFQGVSRRFVLSFEKNGVRTNFTKFYLQLVEIKDYNAMINQQNLFDQPVKDNLITNDNILKIATGQWDNYATGCLLDSPYSRKYYKIITIDLSKQQTLDADPKPIQQINLTANLDWNGNTTIFFNIEETKETILDFSQGTV